jgi:hypothetical protein
MLPGNRPIENTAKHQTVLYEVIDAAELAKRWRVPESWIREQTRSRAGDPLPCVRLGRYVRFQWDSPRLLEWFQRRCQ